MGKKPIKVLFFVTMHTSSNGYSQVGYELAKYLSKLPDIQLTIYGFQNFSQIPNHRTDFPSNVQVYDAWTNEQPRQAGFGVGQVKDFVTMNKPDVVIVYNDMLVLTSVISQLHEVPDRKFKIIAYIDQVYLCQKKEYIQFVNNKADLAMLFTPYWEEIALEQGITLPTCNLRHGFNKDMHYPVPKNIARKFYGLKNEDFIILNLNRNQPRKRWDICLQAFAAVVQKLPDEPIKLLIATATQGAWNLLEIYERELKKRGLTLEQGMKHVILLDNPQQLSDEDVNFLYNVADIGLNTCDGEGFGLCNFQQAAIGIPQVVPYIGGFRDFFNDDNALLVRPSMTYYVDNSRDMVCGEAELCDYNDFADAIIKYYQNKELMKTHGENARKKILKEYPWEKFGDQLYKYVCNMAHTLSSIEEDDEMIQMDETSSVEETIDLGEDAIDIQTILQEKQGAPDKPHVDVATIKDPITTTTQSHKNTSPSIHVSKQKENMRSHMKAKLKNRVKKNKSSHHEDKKYEDQQKTIAELQEKINMLISMNGSR